MEYCGDTYNGEYKNERFEGFGNYTLPTGTTFVGEFHDGMFHGKGALHFVNGSIYEANWEKGCPKNVF